jgi:23S rRNA pseudouridine2604 synthase
MNIDLKGLPIGDWRDLTKNEMNSIYDVLSKSSGEDKKKVSSISSKKNAFPSKHKSTSKSHKSSNASKYSQGKKTARRGKK